MVDTTVIYALPAAPDFFQVEGQIFLDLREGRPFLQASHVSLYRNFLPILPNNWTDHMTQLWSMKYKRKFTERPLGNIFIL